MQLFCTQSNNKNVWINSVVLILIIKFINENILIGFVCMYIIFTYLVEQKMDQIAFSVRD